MAGATGHAAIPDKQKGPGGSRGTPLLPLSESRGFQAAKALGPLRQNPNEASRARATAVSYTGRSENRSRSTEGVGRRRQQWSTASELEDSFCFAICVPQIREFGALNARFVAHVPCGHHHVARAEDGISIRGRRSHVPSRRLVVGGPWGRSLRAVLNKKKTQAS